MSAYDPIDVTEHTIDELKVAVGAAEDWGDVCRRALLHCALRAS